MASESRKQIIEQLKNLKLIHTQTLTCDTLSGASLQTLNAILDQVKKNGANSEKAKQMIKDQAMSKGGKKVADAVQVQLNNQDIAEKISQLSDIQIQLKSGDFSDSAQEMLKQIKGIIKACQTGDKQAIKLVKSLDMKKLKGIKDNTQLIKQFQNQANEANVHLFRFGKTANNIFTKCPIGSFKKVGQTFNETKSDIQKTTWQFKDFANNLKQLKLQDFKKSLNFTNISASAITAIKGIDSFRKNIEGVTQQIIKYHRDTQVVGAANIDLMPGGAKQLDSIRRNMNLTREETISFAKTLTSLRGTTYSVEDLNKAMQGMKQTLGQVDPDKLKDLAAVMQSIPKQQLDAFTSGAGDQGDTMNAIMAMQKSGQTDKVLELGASGAFGTDFAQASGVKINQNQKSYLNNKRAVKTATQTVQNKTQQAISNTPIIGKMFSAIPFAGAAAPLQGVSKNLISLIGAFKKDNNQNQASQNGQVASQTEEKPSANQKKQQDNNKQTEKQEKSSDETQLLKSIDRKIVALLKKKFAISTVDKVKQIDKVKGVAKIKQVQFLRSAKTIHIVQKVNNIKNSSGADAEKGGGVENIVSKAVGKLTQATQEKTSGVLGQAGASTSQASSLGQMGENLFDSALGQRKADDGGKGSFAHDVGGLVENIVSSKEECSADFDFQSFLNGKLSDYLGGGKIQDIIKPQNITNLIKGKFDFKQLKNLQFLKDLKNLKSLAQLKNLKSLLNIRHLRGGKTALKIAGAAHKGYKAFKAAKAAHGIGKAALIGGKLALGGGTKAALAGSGAGLPLAALMHVGQSLIGGAVNVYRDNSVAKNIKKQMGIQQADKGFLGAIEQVADAYNAVINPLANFANNLIKTGSISKAWGASVSQTTSVLKGFAQTFTFGLYKEDASSKEQRQLDIAANTQKQYSAQGFKQIYKIQKRVNQIKKENMKRNQYMAQQYAGFSKKLDLIKNGAYTLQDRLKESVASTKMEKSFMSGADNSDYGRQSANMIAASTDALGKDLQQLSKLKASVMKDGNLTDTQRTVQLLKIQQAQIQARKTFVENLKKALDCRNIPSVIQNGFKTMINNARIETATLGYGGDDDSMFEATGKNIQNAMDDFFATSKFNAQAFSKVQQANAKNLESAMSRVNGLGSSASPNSTMAQIMKQIKTDVGKSNLVGSNDGGDFKGSQMGQIGNRRLTDKEIQALWASGLAQAGEIKELKKGVYLSELQLNQSYTQSSKQEGIKKLMQRFESQRQSGDMQGAKATLNVLNGLQTSLKARGADTQFLNKSISSMQQAAISMGNIIAFKDKSGVDYSLTSSQQNMQQIADKDTQFKTLLSQKGLLDANGNVKQQDEQAVKQAYMDRKVQVGMDNSYDELMKSTKDKEIDFGELVQKHNGDKQAAFKQFSSQMQQKSTGMGSEEIKAANTALENATKTGQITDQLKNNKDNINKILQSGKNKAKTKQDKQKIQSAQDALTMLNSGQKLSVQQRKQLIAKVKQANQLVGVLNTGMDAETRASYQNIATLQAAKNSQVKSVQVLTDYFQSQKDLYGKLIGTIQSLQNAIAKSSNVKRAQLKSSLQKSKSALVQFGGGDVGANLSSVYKSQIGVSQSKVGAVDKALAQLPKLKDEMAKIMSQGGDAFKGQIQKMFSGKDKKIGQMSVAKQGGKDVSFVDAFKQIGNLAKQGANAQEDQQQNIKKKINERQRQLIQANNKSNATAQQKQQRKLMIKARADQARQMVGTKGTIQGVQMKLLADKNNAMAQQINALKNFGNALKTASNSLTSFQASARKSQMATKQRLLKKKLGSGAQSVDIMQKQAKASWEQYQQKKRLQKTKINAVSKDLAFAQARYQEDPSQKNREQLKKQQALMLQAKQGMDAINIQQYQSANQAVAGAMQLVAAKAQLAQQSLSIMQDAAQNVAGTTAQWYKLQNEKLSVMAQQVQGIRNVIKSQAFLKLSNQQKAKYTNQLAKKQLALAKQRIGAQRTVFQKQLGAILGGFQAQGAFQGFNNASVFGIGHGVNQANMAVQRKNMQGGGLDVKTLGRQSRTTFANQGNTPLEGIGKNAQMLGTPGARNLTRRQNADGSYTYRQENGTVVRVGSTIKKDSRGNAIFKRDDNGRLIKTDKGQLIAQQEEKSKTTQSSQHPAEMPQDNQTATQEHQKREDKKKADLQKKDHWIYVDILSVVRDILSTLQKGKIVSTAISQQPTANKNGVLTQSSPSSVTDSTVSATQGTQKATKSAQGGQKETKPTQGGQKETKPTQGGQKETKPTQGGQKETKPTQGGQKETKPTQGGQKETNKPQLFRYSEIDVARTEQQIAKKQQELDSLKQDKPRNRRDKAKRYREINKLGYEISSLKDFKKEAQKQTKYSQILMGQKQSTTQEKQQAFDWFSKHGIISQDSHKVVNGFIDRTVQNGEELNFQKLEKEAKRYYDWAEKSGQEQYRTIGNELSSFKEHYETSVRIKNEDVKEQLLSQNNAKPKQIRISDRDAIVSLTEEQTKSERASLQSASSEYKKALEKMRNARQKLKTANNHLVKAQTTEDETAAQKEVQQAQRQYSQAQAERSKKAEIKNEAREALDRKIASSQTKLSGHDIQQRQTEMIYQSRIQQAKDRVENAQIALQNSPNNQKAKKQLEQARKQENILIRSFAQFKSGAEESREQAIKNTTQKNYEILQKGYTKGLSFKEDSQGVSINLATQLRAIDSTAQKKATEEDRQNYAKTQFQSQEKTRRLHLSPQQRKKYKERKWEDLSTEEKDQRIAKVTQKQALFFDRYRRYQQKQEARTRLIQEGAKSRYDKSQQAKKTSWQDLSEEERQKRIKQFGSEVDSATIYHQRKQRQHRESKDPSIIGQKQKLLRSQIQNGQTQSNYQQTKQRAAAYYNSIGIDFNGGDVLQQMRLLDRFATMQAKSNLKKRHDKAVSQQAERLLGKDNRYNLESRAKQTYFNGLDQVGYEMKQRILERFALKEAQKIVSQRQKAQKTVTAQSTVASDVQQPITPSAQHDILAPVASVETKEQTTPQTPVAVKTVLPQTGNLTNPQQTQTQTSSQTTPITPVKQTVATQNSKSVFGTDLPSSPQWSATRRVNSESFPGFGSPTDGSIGVNIVGLQNWYKKTMTMLQNTVNSQAQHR